MVLCTASNPYRLRSPRLYLLAVCTQCARPSQRTKFLQPFQLFLAGSKTASEMSRRYREWIWAYGDTALPHWNGLECVYYSLEYKSKVTSFSGWPYKCLLTLVNDPFPRLELVHLNHASSRYYSCSTDFFGLLAFQIQIPRMLLQSRTSVRQRHEMYESLTWSSADSAHH